MVTPWRITVRRKSGFSRAHESADLLTQPAMRGIAGHAAMPVTMRLEFRQFKRQGENTRVVAAQKCERRGQYEVGAHGDQRGDQIMLHAGLNRAPQTEFVQFRIDETRPLPAAGHVNMAELQIIVEREFFLRERMLLTQQTRITVAAQRLLFELRIVDQRRIDREIHRAARQRLRHFAASGEITFDADARRLTLQHFFERRQQQGLGEIVHAQAERALRRGRIELLARMRARIEQLQRLAHASDDVFGDWRRHHARGRAHEELIAEGFAHARERIAHGRLRDEKQFRRAREIARAIDGFENNEEIEVDLRQTHGCKLTGSAS
ncbi:hypothetical protein PT2222_60287 [Paraburkholderia tropica]